MFKKEGEVKKYIGFYNQYIIWVAIFTLVGTIIGAGILGIPYVVAKAGVLYGLILMVAIGIAFVYLNLFAGEVILRTNGHHQLTGYAGKYLGKIGKCFMALSLFVNIYGALTLKDRHCSGRFCSLSLACLLSIRELRLREELNCT
ncbi:hypothetical protein J4479_05415 [Candidatus Woesearchaeota archaeon]|nr:hypothetical protein [Candidatus Woesearchaeota archaeon]